MTGHPRRLARRCVALASAVTMTAVLAACGGTGGGSPDELEMWTFKQSHVPALEAAAEQFRQETGITVRIQAITPDDAFLTKVAAAARTNDLPDILEVHSNGDDLTFGGAGLLEDLSGVVDDEWTGQYLPAVANEGIVTQQYYENSLTPGSKWLGVEEGQRFSVPLTIGTFGIVYANKERLAESGYTEPPATWDEFMEMLDAVGQDRPDDGGVANGFRSPSTGLEWLLQPMAYGMLGDQPYRDLFSDDPAVNWGSENGVAALTEYGRIQPYWTPGTQSLTIDEADLSFAHGQSTFDIGGTFTLAFLEANGFDPDNAMTFAVPPPEGAAIPDMGLAPFALTGLSVTKDSHNKDGAIDFVRYLSGTDVAEDFARDALDLPPNDLGPNPEEAVGPVLGAMAASLSSEEDAYHAADTSYRPNAYDSGRVGEVLADFTPLDEGDPADAGRNLANLIESYWSEQQR
ncbi:extracellular solute-binding protein [Streptomyces sp. NPDC049881]|uniref:ABC transporter substrate-binding protein n=1 Tax=unclassified Streptomyces TaxID=2593676 RepID=UPI00341A4C3E